MSRKRKRSSRKLWLFFLLILVAVLGAAHWAVRMDSYRGFQAPVYVEIPRGTSTLGIGELLADAGVIKHPWLFALARLTKPGARPQAGEYEFKQAATPAQVFARIARGDVYLIEVVVPEGSNAFDIAAMIYENGFGGETEALRLTLPDEGYLFPAVYKFKRKTSVHDVVAAMRRRFDRAWSELGAPRESMKKTVTLASLVEKETAVADERSMIAGVYRNRLERGMKLDCDPTVEYAARLTGRWRGTIYKSDLAADHPYNTYQRAGLPPGPIANPGMASLRAAVAPADTNALFFVAKPDGSGRHVFSESLDAHSLAVSEYRKNQSPNGAKKGQSESKSAPVAPTAQRRRR